MATRIGSGQQSIQADTSRCEEQQMLTVPAYFKKHLPEVAERLEHKLEVTLQQLNTYGLSTQKDVALLLGQEMIKALEEGQDVEEKLVDMIQRYTSQCKIEMLWKIFKSRGFLSLETLSNAAIEGLDFNKLNETFPQYRKEEETYVYYLSDEVLLRIFAFLVDPQQISHVSPRFRQIVLNEQNLEYLLEPLCVRLSRATVKVPEITSSLQDTPDFKCSPQRLLKMLQDKKSEIKNPFVHLSRLQDKVAKVLQINPVRGIIAKHEGIEEKLDQLESSKVLGKLKDMIDEDKKEFPKKFPGFQVLLMLRAKNISQITDRQVAESVLCACFVSDYLEIIHEIFMRNLLPYPDLRGFVKRCITLAIQSEEVEFGELLCAYGHMFTGQEPKDFLHSYFLKLAAVGDTNKMKKFLERIDTKIISKEELFHYFCKMVLVSYPNADEGISIIVDLMKEPYFQTVSRDDLAYYINSSNQKFMELLLDKFTSKQERTFIVNTALHHATRTLDKEYVNYLLNLKDIDNIDGYRLIQIILKFNELYDEDFRPMVFGKIQEKSEHLNEAHRFYFHYCCMGFSKNREFKEQSFLGIGINENKEKQTGAIQRSSCELLIRAYIKAIQEGRTELAPHEENYKTYLNPADLQNVQAIDRLTSDTDPETKVTMLENLLANFYKDWGIPAVELTQNK